MHTLIVQSRLSCVVGVLRALRLESALDEERSQLLTLGATSREVAALVGIVRERPAWLLAAKWRDDYALRRQVEQSGLTWDRFFALLPELVRVAEEFQDLPTQPVPHDERDRPPSCPDCHHDRGIARRSF